MTGTAPPSPSTPHSLSPACFCRPATASPTPPGVPHRLSHLPDAQGSAPVCRASVSEVAILCCTDAPGTVYISQVKARGHAAIYRFALNTSLPVPWQTVSPGDGDVPSFQVSSGHWGMRFHTGRGPIATPPRRSGSRDLDAATAGGGRPLQPIARARASQTWVRALAQPPVVCCSTPSEVLSLL